MSSGEREWLAANGPGGWIDDMRKRIVALETALRQIETGCIASGDLHYASIATAALREKTREQREILRQQELVLEGIGPLMDSWDHLPNDVKDYLREESPSLCAELERIAQIYGGNCEKYLE
jgi:hypothetical protein